MKRKIILASITLIVAAAAMTFCLMTNRGEQIHQTSRDPIDREKATSLPDVKDMAPVLKDSRVPDKIGAIKRVEYPMYEVPKAVGRKQGEPKLVAVLRADEARVAGHGKMHTVRPDFVFVRPDQLIRIVADEGDFAGAEGAKATFNPKSGEMKGHVVMTMTRTAAPVAGRAATTAPSGENMRVYTDHIAFDYTENFLQTDAKVRVNGVGRHVLARGLEMHWDGVTRRLSSLRLNTEYAAIPGVREPFPGLMLVRGGMEMMRQGESASAASQPADASPSQGQVARKPKARAVVDPASVASYHAKFLDNGLGDGVQILQGRAAPEWIERIENPAGDDPYNVPEMRAFPARLDVQTRLFSDEQISMLFDFIQSSGTAKSKAAAPAAPAASTASSPARAAAATAGPSASQPDQGDWTVISWSGPLNMDPAAPNDRSEILTGQRRKLIATGHNVTVLQKDGESAKCRYLSYDVETKLAELRGGEGDPVRIEQPKGQRVITSAKLVVDQTNNRITASDHVFIRMLNEAATAATGPAAPATQPADEESRFAVIECDHGAEFRTATTRPDTTKTASAKPTPAAPPAQPAQSGDMGMLRGVYLTEADFVGNVRSRQADRRISAETMTAYFLKPSAGVGSPPIDHIEADGLQDRSGRYLNQVRLVSTGNPMKVEAGPAASRPDASLSVATRPDIASAGLSNPPTSPAARRSPTTQVTNEILCDRLGLKMKLVDGQSVPDRAEAAGRVRSSQDTMSITAEVMDLTFAEAAEVAAEAASPTGPTSQPAETRPPAGPRKRATTRPNRYVANEVQAFRDVVISDPARKLTGYGTHLNGLIQESVATLHGDPAARMQIDDRIITGKAIFTDRNNQVVVVQGEGSLAFTSDRDLLSGQRTPQPTRVMAKWVDRMEYHGKDDVAEMHGAVKTAFGRSYLGSNLLYIYFQDQPTPPTSAPDETHAVAAKARAAPAPDSQPDDLLIAAMGKKRPKMLVAETNVLARTSEVAPEDGRTLTMATIHCQQLTFDNNAHTVLAAGAGYLQLADYRPPDKTKKAGDDNADPSAGGSRPSQTEFAWEDRMEYDSAKMQAHFVKTVRMTHRGPKGVLVRRDGSVEMLENVPPAKLTSKELWLQFASTKPAGSAAGTPGASGAAGVVIGPTAGPITPTPPVTTGSPAAPAAGAGMMGRADSGTELAWMRSVGNVYLEQENLRLLGELLEYQKEANTVTFEGDADRKAELWRVAPDGTKFDHLVSPRIQWNRTTGRVEPFEGTIQSSGGGK